MSQFYYEKPKEPEMTPEQKEIVERMIQMFREKKMTIHEANEILKLTSRHMYYLSIHFSL